jgi:hypothetical protein
MDNKKQNPSWQRMKNQVDQHEFTNQPLSRQIVSEVGDKAQLN